MGDRKERSPFLWAIDNRRSKLIVSFSLTTQEKQDVIAFLHSLTDWTFVCDPRFADPFGNFPRSARCN